MFAGAGSSADDDDDDDDDGSRGDAIATNLSASPTDLWLHHLTGGNSHCYIYVYIYLLTFLDLDLHLRRNGKFKHQNPPVEFLST